MKESPHWSAEVSVRGTSSPIGWCAMLVSVVSLSLPLHPLPPRPQGFIIQPSVVVCLHNAAISAWTLTHTHTHTHTHTDTHTHSYTLTDTHRHSHTHAHYCHSHSPTASSSLLSIEAQYFRWT